MCPLRVAIPIATLGKAKRRGWIRTSFLLTSAFSCRAKLRYSSASVTGPESLRSLRSLREEIMPCGSLYISRRGRKERRVFSLHTTLALEWSQATLRLESAEVADPLNPPVRGKSWMSEKRF